MPDAPPPPGPVDALGGHPAAPAAQGAGEARPEKAAQVELILAEFRAWLLAAEAAPAPEPPATSVDLLTLVGQFTALRHEVNLQTRASRSTTEQIAEVLAHLKSPPPAPADPGDGLKPVVMAVIEVVDALERGARECEARAEQLRDRLAQPPEPPAPPGRLARWLGRAAPAGPSAETLEWAAAVAAGLAEGYRLSLRRVERLMPLLQLEAIEALGEPFDPEVMEAIGTVEVDADEDGPRPDEVVEVARAGYLWRGAVLRVAQVRVAQ